MAYTTIDDPQANFQVELYTGNGSADHAMTFDGGTDMQPDVVWFATRSNAANHQMHNALTAETYHYVRPNATNALITSNSDALTSFNSDGFTIGSDGVINENTYTYVAWCWKANGSGAANSEGNTTTTKTSANTTSGFSIITYDGDGAAATLGHGLGAVPHFIIQKNLDDTENWQVYHHKNTAAPETDYLTLNTTNATGDQSSRWNDTAPTSTLISIGSDSSVSQSGESMLMLAWSEKQGFSKFGSYEGNGNADGPFVYTGFRPAFIMLKRSDSTGGWYMYDIKRPGRNNENGYLQANSASAEDTNSGNFGFDILSNGFKLRGTYATVNASGGTFVYMAWADQPFVNSEGEPANAR